jgi:hypothetical protein
MKQITLAMLILLSFILFEVKSVKANINYSGVEMWKLPLPEGNYQISQGDRDDPACTSHCKGSPFGAFVECAIDIAAQSGTPVLAPAPGKVLISKYNITAGEFITILHDNGLVSQYQHLKSRYVFANERVTTGQPIGRVDSTGNSNGSHLHFGIFTDNNYSSCIKITSIDGNNSFLTNNTIISHNIQNGSLPDDDSVILITPQPPVKPQSNSSKNYSLTDESIDNYLYRKNSPLAGLSSVFVDAGQIYNVDPRFVIAISNAESSLGKNGSCASQRHNAWGYGGGWPNCWNFNSWEDAIWQVTRDIGEYYFKKYNQDTIPAFVIEPSGTCTTHCWCASGCSNWISIVENTYEELGGNKLTSSLNFSEYRKNSAVVVTVTAEPKSEPKSQVPGIPVLISPENESENTTKSQIVLRWKPTLNAFSYRIELWGGQYNLMKPCNGVKDTKCEIGTMWPGKMYWRVKAISSNGQESEWSQTWSFTVLDIINKPEITESPSQIIDKTKPTGDYSSPNDGSLVECKVKLSAWAQDLESGVKEVHFTAKWNNNWSLVENDTTPPYEYVWDLCSANIPNGDIELGLDIFDNAGNEFNLHTKHANIHIIKNSATLTPPPPPPSTNTGNLAPKANRNPDGIGSAYAFDGNLSTFWIDGLGHGFNLTLNWNELLPVNRVIVWDRPQNSPDNNQINALIIKLSNGISKRFGMDSMGSRCIDIRFNTPQTISWITLIADDASGNNGLSEVEIWVGDKTTSLSCGNSGSIP